MQIPLIDDIIIIFGLSIPVLFLCNRLRVPTIVGFLLTGILAGPHGLGLINAVKEVEILAEIGVVLLLFTIGIEFSLKSLLQVKRIVLLGGSLQLFLTLLATFAIAKQLDLSTGRAVFVGLLVSLSSTAIALRVLQEKAEIESPHGRSALAILIFQDIAVVPMMLLIPVLAGSSVESSGSPVILLAEAVGIVLLVAVSAKWIVPKALYQVARTRSRELFLVAILVICFAVAWLTHKIGLSLALGAFLAGLIISESEYSHQTLGNILPFRDVFTSLFFVSIGMLLNFGFLLQKPAQLFLLVVGVMALKALLASSAVSILGYPMRIGIRVGLSICQIGEFSFILSMAGVEYGLLTKGFYQLFLAVAVLTMGSTPFIMGFAPRVANAATRLPLPKRLIAGSHSLLKLEGPQPQNLQDHLIIVGFGFNGRNLAQAAKVAGISYVIIEMNPETVKKEQASGEPIFYGDATRESVLEHARISHARVLVIAIPDPAATRGIIVTAHGLNPKLHIIARTRFIQEMADLYKLGADEVIPEEFETSVEIFARVMNKYLLPRDEIDRFITEIREDGYQMLRSAYQQPQTLCDVQSFIPDIEVTTFRLQDGSPLAGKSVREIDLRKNYGVTLLAIKRGAQILSNPEGTTELLAGDQMILIGSSPTLATVAVLAQQPDQSGDRG